MKPWNLIQKVAIKSQGTHSFFFLFVQKRQSSKYTEFPYKFRLLIKQLFVMSILYSNKRI